MEITMELRKFVAPEIITGVDARLMVGRYITHFAAAKPMIVTDKNLRTFQWFQDTMEEVGKYVHDCIVFDDVTANPREYEVMKGAELFLAEKCDLIIAIGGGSPIDCAKGISIVSSNGGYILEYEGVDEINLPGPPLICIPTTAGASADVSQFAIINDSVNHLKKAIISKKVVPDLALIDPVPLMTMDPYLTACTGMDAMTHAIEAYVSNANSYLSDVRALDAIRLINENIIKASQENHDLYTIYLMMLGSLEAGLAFSNASLGAVHAMAHSLGGLLDLPHGECNSILLEHIVNVNFEFSVERYTLIAKQMGLDVENANQEDIKLALLNWIRTLRKKLQIAGYAFVDTLNDEILDKLSEGALADPCLVTNPKLLTMKEVRAIYEKILRRREK